MCIVVDYFPPNQLYYYYFVLFFRVHQFPQVCCWGFCPVPLLRWQTFPLMLPRVVSKVHSQWTTHSNIPLLQPLFESLSKKKGMERSWRYMYKAWYWHSSVVFATILECGVLFILVCLIAQCTCMVCLKTRRVKYMCTVVHGLELFYCWGAIIWNASPHTRPLTCHSKKNSACIMWQSVA